MKKYFETLEIDVSASIEEVDKAYKELTEAWRPENYQNLPRFKRKAEIKLEEVNDAYERIRSYLLLKASGKDQMMLASTKDPSAEPEPETTPVEKTQSPQISPPSKKKKLLPGLIAVAVVLGALMLYLLISNRQKPQIQTPQTIVAQKYKATQDSDTAPPSVSAGSLLKKSKSNSAVKSSAEKRSSSSKPALQKSPAKIRPDYDSLLTQKALSRFNRNPVRIKRIQNGLVTVGYDTGPIDGVIGPQTTAALKKFANDRGHVIEASHMFASDLANTVLVFAEVSATHPDWDQIIGSQDFSRWLDSQTVIPAYQVKKLKNSATARQIREALDLYKSDKKTL